MSLKTNDEFKKNRKKKVLYEKFVLIVLVIELSELISYWILDECEKWDFN